MNRPVELRIAPTGADESTRTPADPHEMSDPQLLEVVEAAIYSGIRRICWAGGEPLLRPGFVEMVRSCRQLGVVHQRLTTDGVHYAEMADALQSAGIRQVDICTDTLDPAYYRRVHGHDSCAQVEQSIRKAATLYDNTKVNCIISRDNASQMGRFIERADAYQGRLAVRFVELDVPRQSVPDPNSGLFEGELVPMHEVFRRLRSYGTLSPAVNRWNMSRSFYFHIKGHRGIVGVHPTTSASGPRAKNPDAQIWVNANGYVTHSWRIRKHSACLKHVTLGPKAAQIHKLVVAPGKRQSTADPHIDWQKHFWAQGNNPAHRSKWAKTA